MAHFYVEIQGSRGAVHRLGGIDSGVSAVCASWQGAVTCRTYVKNGEDRISIRFSKWNGSGSEGLIYDGPISGAKKVKRSRV